jgi:Histidine kinase-, DNA gyrase B-, and HSP90-like ATPase
MKGAAQTARVAFTTSRALEFFTESELTTQIGYRKELWSLVLIKELIDNAIDACETAATKAIEIGVELDKDSIAVSDNGPGIAHKIIKGVLDCNVRISDKKHYVAPTRGQLGNALKCVVAAPFVATGKRSVLEIVARGRRYTIQVELDRLAQKPKITCDTTDAPPSIGTFLKIYWPRVASYFSNLYSDLFQYDSLSDAVEALIQDYATLNPHVTFTFNKTRRAASDTVWSKWRTDAPTSVHWYRPEDLRALIAAHICERDLPLWERCQHAVCDKVAGGHADPFPAGPAETARTNWQRSFEATLRFVGCDRRFQVRQKSVLRRRGFACRG